MWKLSVSVIPGIILRVHWLFLGLARRNGGRGIVRARVLEVVFRVMVVLILS